MIESRMDNNDQENYSQSEKFNAFEDASRVKGCKTRFFWCASKDPWEQSAETNAFWLRPVSENQF